MSVTKEAMRRERDALRKALRRVRGEAQQMAQMMGHASRAVASGRYTEALGVIAAVQERLEQQAERRATFETDE